MTHNSPRSIIPKRMDVKTLSSTNWGAEITTDIKSCSEATIRKIAYLATEKLVLLVRKQKLTRSDEVRISNQMGDTEKNAQRCSFSLPN